MTKRFYIILLAIGCTMSLWAAEPKDQPQQEVSSGSKSASHSAIFSGFSVGIMGNLGYAFSSNPKVLFGNGTLTNIEGYEYLPKQNVTLGAGVMARVHLLHHLHVGAEGYVSTMPLMKTGSSLRHAYAGALVDGYLTLGKCVLFAGTGLGGGKLKRMFVPATEPAEIDNAEDVVYNASYTTTPYFYLDPYLGMEIHMGALLGLIIKADYMLPFSKSTNGLIGSIHLQDNMKGLITPTGPRLHVGILLGK